MGINDNYVKALTKMASDPKNQEAYRQRVATIQADMQRVREQEVLADFNQWKTDNGVVDVPQPKAPVMKSVDELRKPTQTREYNKKLANDQRIKETLARKQRNVSPYRKNYGNINVSKRERQQNKDGTYSTILGASNAFAGNNGEYEVSYSPFLQTGTGTPEKLDDSTMQTYINSVLREAEKKPGGATEKNILAVDKQGYNVNGKQISGMIAGAAKYGANGENDPNVQRVIRSAEEMHYAGEYYDKLADSAKAKDIVMKQNKGRDEYVRRQQVKEATMKQNQGRDKYILNQQKLEAATPVTTPEQTKQTPVSNYLTGNSTPNNSFYNNTGVSISRTADKKAKAVQQESVLVKDMNNAAEVDGVVNQWLAKDKLTGAEKKQAQKIYQQKKHALDLASSDWYRTMSTADATKKYNEELQKIEPLNLKSRGSMPFNYGLFKGLGTNSILKAEGDVLAKVTGDEGYKDAFNGVDTLSNMAQEENNVAYGAGNLTGELLKNAAEYGVANEVIGASRLGQAINNGAKKLPGGRFFGDAYANLATGQLADTLIDTPRTIAYNARDGKYIDENGNVDMGKVLADIGINQAVNLGFNAAFGAGELRRGIKSYPARRAAEQAEKDARDIAFHDLLNATNRNTPEAVAREEADLLTQARQYGEARKIAEANNAKVQLQTPEATAKEESELLAQARAMGEERAKASKQFEKVKQSVLKDFDPNSNRSWQKTINKLSEYRKKYGDSANEDIMSFARDLESYSKGIEGTEVEKVLGPRRTVNVTERPRKFNGDMRTSEDFARNSTYIAEPLQREGMREAIGEDLYNRLEKSYVNWMDEYFRMDKTAGAANELELRAKYLEDTLDDVAKVTGDDFSNIKNAIRQNNELAIADNYGTTKFVTDYKGDHAGTKAKEPGYQFSDLTEEESELVDRSLRSARSAVGELDNRVREIQNRYNDWTKSGYGGNTYNPVSDTLAAQLDELKSSYNIYADAIADPAHEGLGYAKRALIRDLEKTRKLVNEEGKFNVNFGKQLSMDINGAEKAIYGHNIGNLSDAVKEETTLPIRAGNNADRLATDVKFFANRTELKKPSTVAETKEPVPTLTAKPQKEEKPFKDALDSRLTKDGELERSFAMNTRVGKVEGIPKEVQQQFADNPAMYKQLKNADTVANAMKAREEAGDIGQAYNKFRSMLKEKNPEAIVMGHQLAKEYSAMGDYDMASNVIRETAEELTKAGQFTQAAAIAMMKDDPMTARAYLEKEIDALNRGAKERFGDGFENFKLTKEEKEMFNDIKPGDTKALKEAYDKVGARLGREYPTTLWQKVVEGRHLAMLFNPRTHIRNTVANVLLLPQRTVSNRVNAVLERGMSAINKDFDVTQSLKGGSKQQKAVGNYLYKTEIANALENAQKYVEGIGGKSGSKLSDYAKDADVFKGSALSHWLNKKTGGKLAESVEKMGGNGAESMLELLRRMDYKALDVEDQIFVKKNFTDRLASYMAAKGIKPSDEVLAAMKSGDNKELVDEFLSQIPPEGISLALDEALKATFKDDNAFTKLLVGFKKLAPHTGEFVLPFTKTPANLAVRAYDYSPAGAVHGIVKAVKSKDVQGIRNGLDRLSKGLTGTGMLAAGYALRQSGLITGGYDKDKDKKQQQIKEGYKPYAIHIGDKYYTYDWAEPASSSLVMASEIYDAMNDGSKQTNLATAGAKAIQTGVDTWVNSSPLSSFADLMGSGSVSSSVGERAMETALNFPGSFVPAVVGATSKVSDTTQRNTYDPNNPVKSAMNQVVAKIPELSKTLPAKYDTWGNEIKRYESKGEAAFANYLNPGVYSREKHTPIDDAIEKLYDETGDNGVYPLTAEYKIKLDDGTEKKLSAKEQSEYQKTMGKASYKMVSDFLKSDNAKGLDSGEKVDVIRGMYSFSKALAQKDIAGKEIKDSTAQKAYAEYEKAGGGDKGLKAVEKFYENKSILNKAGMQNTEENQAMVNKGGLKAVQQEADIKAALKEAGLQNNEKNRELYKSGGEEALQQKANRTEVLKEYGYSNGTKAATVYDEKGEEGLKVLTETKSKLESGNQTTSVKNAMNYLDKQSMSDEDKGYYLSQSMSNMGGKAKAYVDKGDYEGFYEYEQKRTAADGDKNGSLKKSEVTDYLDSQNMTASQKKFWFEQLGQKKWKNPYK